MEENVIIDFLACHDVRPLIDKINDPRDEHSFIAGLKQEIESNGTQPLFTRYSPMVKMLERCSQTKAIVTTTALDILDIGWTRLAKIMKQSDGKYKDIDPGDIVEHRKTLALLFFLTYRAIMEIENYRYGEAQQKFLRTMTEKRKGQPLTGHFPYWPDYRLKLLKSCLAVIKCDLNAFWGNHEVETGSGFLRCVLLFSMIILRQSAKDITRDDKLADVLNEMLGIMATKYGEEQSILSRLAPIVKEGEDAAKAVTGVLICLTNNFGREMVIFTAVKDVLDLSSENLSKESATDKSLGVFLQEIIHVNPKAILKCLPLICEFLEAESFGVRSSVLTICTELLIWSKKNETEADLKLRGEILDTVLSHLLDGNAHVRSKVIQLLTRLIKEEHLHTFEALRATEELQKRVFDKTPTARKHALAFFAEMIKIDPVLAKFTPSAWEENVRKSHKKLIELLVKDLDSTELELKVAVTEFLRELEAGYRVDRIPMQDSAEALTKITELLTAKDYWEACEYMHNAVEKFKDDDIFQLSLMLGKFATYIRFFKHLLKLEAQGEENELDEGDVVEPEAAKDFRKIVDYYELRCGMNAIIYNLIPQLSRLLDSGMENDRNEVISLYAQLVESDYQPDEAMLKCVLDSVRHIDGKTMTSQIESCCSIIFRGVDVSSERDMLKKLVELANTADILQKGSISNVVRELVNAKKLKLKDSMQILLDGFRLIIPDWTPEHSRGAVFILGLLGGMNKSLMEDCLDLLVEVGLGPRGYEDIGLMRAVCETINMMCPKFDKTRKDDQQVETKRFDVGYPLFEKLRTVILDGLRLNNTFPEDEYIKVAEMALHIIYGLCMEPNGMITKLVRDIGEIVFKRQTPMEEDGNDNNVENMDARSEAAVDQLSGGNSEDLASQGSVPQTAKEINRVRRKPANPSGFDDIQLSESILYRYVSIIRFLLGAHINFYDKMVTAEIKRRKAMIQSKTKQPKRVSKDRARPSVPSRRNSTTPSARPSVDASVFRTPQMNGTGRESVLAEVDASGRRSASVSNASATASSVADPIVSEMHDMLGSNSYDPEMDMIQNYINKIIFNNGCFKTYKTHVLYLCRRINELKYSKLKASIICCLGKTMSVSSQSMIDCEQTYLDAWRDSESPEVKCELIRCSVLLNVRFPSHMEKINECLMQGLTDPEAIVRMAALDAITYLTLKDLMKTRDQLADASVCLLDSCTEIQEMTKHFFSKCNEKANAIQNALPEILSRLIQRSDVDQVQLQDIMKHLMSYVKPEKRSGGALIDKIATLFQKAPTIRYCQDLAFCLKQFTYNEKQFKFIIDHLPHYADKLADDEVYDSFVSILENARKNCKPDHRLKLEDYEKELLSARNVYENQQRIMNNVNRKDAPAPARRNSDSTISSEDEEFAQVNRVRDANARTPRANRNRNNDEGADDEDGPEQQLNRTRSRITRMAATAESRRMGSMIREPDKENRNPDGDDSSDSEEEELEQVNRTRTRSTRAAAADTSRRTTRSRSNPEPPEEEQNTAQDQDDNDDNESSSEDEDEEDAEPNAAATAKTAKAPAKAGPEVDNNGSDSDGGTAETESGSEDEDMST